MPLTPVDLLPATQRRILLRLRDGLPHSIDDLMGQLYSDGHGALHHLQQHIYQLRRYLVGEVIVTQRRDKKVISYRLVRIAE